MVFRRCCTAPDNLLIFSRLACNPLSHKIPLGAASNLTAYRQTLSVPVLSYATCVLLGQAEVGNPLQFKDQVQRIMWLEGGKGLAMSGAAAGVEGGCRV